MRGRGVQGSGTVVLAVPDFEPSVGGTSRMAGLLARALVIRGRDVAVLTRRRSREWAREEVVDGVTIVRVGSPGHGRLEDKLGSLAPLPWLLRSRSSVAVFHAIMWPDVLYAAAPAGLLDRALITWAARGEATAALAGGGSLVRRTQARLRHRLLRDCRHVALTPRMREELREHRLANVEIVPLPVDTHVFRPPSAKERRAARRHFGLDGEFAVVYVGHLRALKAVDRLIDAFGGLRREGANARLLLVGGSRGAADDVEAGLRARTRTLALDDVVRFGGVLHDPRPAYWAADAFVLPSTQEGMPLALVEAMACGLACVAPASAAGDELLADGCGVVPSSNEPEDLLAALRALAGDSARRIELGRRAAQRVQDFDSERVTDEYERIYRELEAKT